MIDARELTKLPKTIENSNIQLACIASRNESNIMFRYRKASERGHGDHGWLNSYHTFSFADYHDPEHMSFRALRVMNEDRVAPGQGFGTHGHANMEIVSYVLEGELEHKDSMGNGEVLRPGEFQRMSAGTGIRHSEFNPSKIQPAHFYQIWLTPKEQNIQPSYEQKRFPDSELANRFRVVGSPDGRDGSLTICQDALVYLSKLSEAHELTYPIANGRHAWLQVLRGKVQINDLLLESGDGLAISSESVFTTVATIDAELMLFDLA
jgi:quercetin 2,3-dioxygenase